MLRRALIPAPPRTHRAILSGVPPSTLCYVEAPPFGRVEPMFFLLSVFVA